jgi:hypothetical protein
VAACALHYKSVSWLMAYSMELYQLKNLFGVKWGGGNVIKDQQFMKELH